MKLVAHAEVVERCRRIRGEGRGEVVEGCRRIRGEGRGEGRGCALRRGCGEVGDFTTPVTGGRAAQPPITGVVVLAASALEQIVWGTMGKKDQWMFCATMLFWRGTRSTDVLRDDGVLTCSACGRTGDHGDVENHTYIRHPPWDSPFGAEKSFVRH